MKIEGYIKLFGIDWSSNKVRILDIDVIIIFYKNINGRKENRNQRVS